MFLFFPLPAGVLLYMLIANVFQTIQTYLLMREPLPEDIQKMVEQQEKQEKAAKAGDTREALPFERRSKKKASS
jgi:YidC/Oxa1 family membrane protein insertase